MNLGISYFPTEKQEINSIQQKESSQPELHDKKELSPVKKVTWK
jgi:hypothetical protein